MNKKKSIKIFKKCSPAFDVKKYLIFSYEKQTLINSNRFSDF